MPHQYCTSFPDIAQEKSRAKIEQKDKIVQNFFFQLFLFRLFDFDLIPKIENSEEENSEKNSEISKLSEVSEFLICHFLDFLIKCPRFKFIDWLFPSFACSFVFLSYFIWI